ncbi:MAG: chemotaxis protein CheX [Desulfatibacillum sp.]|nr:chemotaxis protein CheX [Desulfatibacillum sp.]
MEPENPIKEILKQVVLNVFEQMYFMFPREIGMEDALKHTGDETYIANVVLKNGGLEVMIAGSGALCLKMAGNMFGEAKALSQQEMEDVVREAANIITGNLINECSFPGVVSPDIPVARKGIDLDICNDDRDLNVFFDVENHYLSVHVRGLASSGLALPGGKFMCKGE